MMKTFALAAAAAALLASAATQVSAATFLGSFDVTYNKNDPGLVVEVAPDPGVFGPFDLDVGESKTFHIFNIWTNEGAVNADDLADKPISVAFAFSSPVAGGTLGGSTDGKVALCTWVGCPVQYGTVDWSNPLNLTFGPGGSGALSVSLSDEKFNKGIFFGTKPGEHWGAKVYATITYDLQPVPLPAAGWLLLAGVGGIVAMKRRRKAA